MIASRCCGSGMDPTVRLTLYLAKLTMLQTYMPLFLPPPPVRGGTNTEAPAAAPP